MVTLEYQTQFNLPTLVVVTPHGTLNVRRSDILDTLESHAQFKYLVECCRKGIVVEPSEVLKLINANKPYLPEMLGADNLLELLGLKDKE